MWLPWLCGTDREKGRTLSFRVKNPRILSLFHKKNTVRKNIIKQTMKKDLPLFVVWNVLFLSTLAEVTQWPDPVCHQTADNGECQADTDTNTAVDDELISSSLNSSSSSNGGSRNNDDHSSTGTGGVMANTSHDKISSTEAIIEEEPIVQQEEPYRCNVYMAPSSIPGAGFGIFTVRDIAKGEKILPYADAPSIPLCDDHANGMEETDWNHVDYLWSGKGLAEYECQSVSESVVTFGALCNFHTVSPM